MRPHLVVKLYQESPEQNIPHWEEYIRQPGLPYQERLHPSVDSIIRKFNTPVMVTREYRPEIKDKWSDEELKSGLNRIYRIVLRKNTSMPKGLIDAISLLPAVERVTPGTIVHAELPEAQTLQARNITDMESRRSIHVPEAHRFTRGDGSVTVAVLDTGVSMQHPEYRHALKEGYDFVNIIEGAEQFVGDYLDADPDPSDEVGHGSHVTGIICAKGMNMPQGVVPECRILPVRVLGALRQGSKRVGAGLIDNINNAIKWAVDKGADVINMSLGVRHTGGEALPHEEVINYAKQKGVSVVAASGNDGSDTVYYPGGHPYVITVGAADPSQHVASFSTYGRQVDLIAPGTDIYSTYLGDQYAFSTGTSHASPFVTGAVALLKSYAASKGKKLNDRQVKHILKNSSDKTGKRFKDIKAGYGMLNLADALRLLEYKLH